MTLAAAARAVVIRFDPKSIIQHPHVFVRAPAQLDAILETITPPSLILHTVVDETLRAHLERRIADLGLDAQPLLDPLVDRIAEFLDEAPRARPGQQYQTGLDDQRRIAAIDYAITQDDGQSPARLLAADVILVGVSRTSKTPTSIYLAYQGIRAANVPLTGNPKALEPLLQALAAGIPAIGLVVTPNRLAQVRAHRLEVLDRGDAPGYADLDSIREEVADARLFFERHDIPVVDVTRRSIEEIAAAILAHLRKRSA
ncbi:pyruvate, water dikinase regulatory protein [Pontivivens ytuae]|uniref:Pyruvate, phosphate dikinase/phosphoenolpyruvate synthase regulator n=1 Tax=Pontivivens ytuae TaxID=2789856 RepID=A0A7S9LV94_9RHOB|nr:pyruvate, phosphate dikinase/phosphoenolpyruvate synthase regulator [Pontivivens ytuae]QPH55889.1 pyruvate, phosphate dikinase/phosphoenolpyruvate synthase regulator [Pontivivens ytuae]